MTIYAEALRRHRDELNSLNVYPVPDGDTGTNMLRTQEAVTAALAGLDGERADLAATREAISRASLMGARGNSGVILSQILRGICERLGGDPVAAGDEAGGRELAAALHHATAEAYRAVARPVEGTILSVIRDAAEAAAQAAARPGADCASVVGVAVAEARNSLARTPELLPQLARAGVVDAGGKGALLLLDALLAALRDEAVTEEVGPLGPVGTDPGQEAAASGSDGTNLAFEVQYLLEADDAAVLPLRAVLEELGDSLVVVGGGGLYNVHIHTDAPDLAVKAGRDAGSSRDVSIVSLEGRVTSCIGGQAREVRVTEGACALVAVAEGDGVGRTFRSLGAVVVQGGPGNNPAVSELLTAIELAPAPAVVVLPNHRNVIPAAERAAVQTSKHVRVIQSRSIPAGVAAAAAFNPLAEVDENAKEMERASSSCRSGEVALAERGAETQAGPVRAGDWLGLADGEVCWVGDQPADAAVAVARCLEGRGTDPEILTLVVGADASAEGRGSVEAALRGSFPELVIEVIEGGQPRYPYLIGME